MPTRKEKREILFQELWKAHLKARKGKRKTFNENEVEIQLVEVLWKLVDAILERKYKPGRGIAFVIHRPVEREVFGAPYIDRIIHHYIVGKSMNFFTNQFIYDTASCIEGRGQLFAVKRAEHYIRSLSDNFKEPVVVNKFDISGFFMNLNRELLVEKVFQLLEKQFAPEERDWEYGILKYLWREILLDDPTEGVRIKGSLDDWALVKDGHSLLFQDSGLGLVIGNLSSQVVSNVLMNDFDRYVTMELGWKAYVRYVDDFVIFVKKKDMEKFRKDILKIERFLERDLGCKLHPNKRYSQEADKYFEFVGARIKAGSRLPSKRLEKHFYEAMEGYMKGGVRYTEQSIISYLGLLEHYKSIKVIQRGCRRVGIDYKGLMAAKEQGGNAVIAFLRAEKLLGKARGEGETTRKKGDTVYG